VIKRARLGVSDPRRPLGVLLFAGPTGVGKTELALALTEALFDEQDALLRLDMSEYMEKHQVSRLIGSPPGYAGYEDEGQLTGWLRRRPYSIVLLDEMEKADTEVQDLFLQLFDAGRLTDGRGRIADGRNALFIITTNLGAQEALSLGEADKTYQEKLQFAIDGHFSSEFLGRLDRIIYFNPMTHELMEAIFDRLLEGARRGLEGQGIQVEVTPPFRADFCHRHADPLRGARPLLHAIEDEIIGWLGDQMLEGKLSSPAKVSFDLGQVIISPAAPPDSSRNDDDATRPIGV